MSVLNIISTLNRLTLQSSRTHNVLARNITNSASLLFRFTPCLMAEPLKKKKKLDPAILKSREERRKKKIEKQIRRLEKNARQLKPIEECDVPLSLLDEKKQRLRNLPPLSHEVLEERVKLEKQWANYKREEKLRDIQMIDRIGYSQQKALDELRKESEELYQEAIQIDFQLVPFTTQGPVSTPAIENYDSPDGNYQDISRKWEA